MLASGLAPLPQLGINSMAEMTEAFFLSTIASYPDAVLTSRVFQSYQRAWGFTECKVYPKVGRVPSFSVTSYHDTNPKKIVVAIAGISSLSDLNNSLFGNLGAVTVISGWGQVLSFYRDCANAIRTVLEADPNWGAIASPFTRHAITFTGFSLGAAIAEILTAMYRIQYPAFNIRLYKFAAPRVGTLGWRNATEANLNKLNFYIYGDPIWRLPTETWFREAALPFRLDVLPGFLCADSFATGMNAMGVLSDGYFPYSALDMIGIMSRLPFYSNFVQDPLDPNNNPWWWHLRTTMRFAFCNFWARGQNQTMKDRVLYLEHPDENSWQQNFVAGGNVTGNMLEILAPPPADHAIAPEVQQRAFELAAGAGGGGEWADDRGAGGEGDWGDIAPAAQAGPQLRVRITQRH